MWPLLTLLCCAEPQPVFQPSADADGDGHDAAALGGDDCDDDDAAVHPGAEDPPGDGVDADCDGLDGTDLDGDGVLDHEDCAPTDPTVYPGAPEVCGDGVDDDCDGVADPGCPGPAEVDGAEAFAIWLAGGDGHRLGFEVALSEDLTGDGRPDAAVGGHRAPGTPDERGYVYVVAGPAAPGLRQAVEDVHQARVEGPRSGDLFGFATVAAGDLTGDGAPDLVVGGVTADGPAGTDAGAVWLLAGPVAGGSADAGGWRLDADAAEDFLGYAVHGCAGGCDVTGDGEPDLVAGAPQSYLFDGARAVEGAGYAVVVAGPLPSSGVGSVADAAAARLEPAGSYDGLGTSVALLPDLDGDGVDEVGAGSVPLVPTRGLGSWCVWTGPPPGSAAVGDADTCLSTGVQGDLSGWGVTGAGDLDGDGRQDLALSTRGAANGIQPHLPSFPGHVSLITALPSGPASDLEVAWGLVLPEVEDSPLGSAVVGPGDLDGDGRGDLVVTDQDWPGGGGSDAAPRGALYLLAGPLQGTWVAGAGGVVVRGERDKDSLGVSVALGPDVTGDGVPDLLGGAYRSGLAGDGAGAAYLFSGVDVGL